MSKNKIVVTLIQCVTYCVSNAVFVCFFLLQCCTCLKCINKSTSRKHFIFFMDVENLFIPNRIPEQQNISSIVPSKKKTQITAHRDNFYRPIEGLAYFVVIVHIRVLYVIHPDCTYIYTFLYTGDFEIIFLSFRSQLL